MWESVSLPKGFPRQPSAVALVASEDEQLLALGGAFPGALESFLGGSCRSMKDFEELCCAGEAEVSADLWLCPLTEKGLEAQPPSKALQFPPKPRAGFTLTALDRQRLLLFGGRATGKHGSTGQRCLADVHILELSAHRASDPSQRQEANLRNAGGEGGRRPSCDSDSSEAEDIFFASDYRAVCRASAMAREVQEKLPAREQPRPHATPGRSSSSCAGRRRAGGTCSSSEEEEESEEERASDFAANMQRPGSRMGGPSMPRTLQDVVSRLGGEVQVNMTRRTSGGASSSTSTAATSSEEGARWRQPLVSMEEDARPPRARVCHTAVLQAPAVEGGESAVLIYGGCGEGGVPLGDTFVLRVKTGEDQSLEAAWSCLDDGGAEHCETAPWEQQTRPRPRACHSAVFWPGTHQRGMLVFGGLGLGIEAEPRAFGDTWLLMVDAADSASCLGTSAPQGWRRPLMQGGAPARRFGHGACLVGRPEESCTMLVCGGFDSSGRPLMDCWVLHLEEMRWEMVESFAPQPPLGRQMLLSTAVDTAPAPELGRCTASWLPSQELAVVWGGGGLWFWREPPQLRWQRTEKRWKAEETAAEELKRMRKEARRKRKEKEGHKVSALGAIAGLDVLEVLATEQWRRADQSVEHSWKTPVKLEPLMTKEEPRLGDPLSGPTIKLGELLVRAKGSKAGKLASLAPDPLPLHHQAPHPIALRDLQGVPPSRRRHLPPAGARGQVCEDELPSRSLPLVDVPSGFAAAKVTESNFQASWPPQRPPSRRVASRGGPPSAPSSQGAAARLDLGPSPSPGPLRPCLLPACRPGTPKRH